MKYVSAFVVALASFLAMDAAHADALIIQSTTSTQNSGLYEALLPQFTAETGIPVHVVAVGTGQAIQNAARCDGDALVVHAEQAELKFIEDGFGLRRSDLMYNDFVLIGPADDPVKAQTAQTITEALTLIARGQARFASRGDDSGTHKKEIALWRPTRVNMGQVSGRWYREMGAGMGATLNAAVGMNAYTLSDRATWIAFENKQNHKILFEGDDALFNQYGIVTINPKHCPKINHKDAQRFIDWMVSEKGQAAINAYRRDGQQLFFANAPR